MGSRRGAGVAVRNRGTRCRSCAPILGLLAMTVLLSLVLFSFRATSTNSGFSNNKFGDVYFNTEKMDRKLSALDHIETLIPKEVLDVIYSKPEHSSKGPLNLKLVVRKERPSLLQEEQTDASGKVPNDMEQKSGAHEHEADEDVETKAGLKETDPLASKVEESHAFESDAGRRSTKGDEGDAKEETEANDKSKSGKEDDKSTNHEHEDLKISDSMVRLLRDQLIMGRAYTAIAESSKNWILAQDLKVKTKEHQKTLGESNLDSELPSSAKDGIQQMGQLLLKAQEQHQDNAILAKKLREMLQSSEEHTRTLKKESTFLSQLAAKTIPKSLHCLSMLLTVEFHMRPQEKQNFPLSPKLEDPSLYHYALFSDNILAAAVVVNSTILHAKEPEKHVFHLVTDKMNFGAMKMWFLENPPGKATIQVENVDDLKWLNSSYCPVLQQLESNSMKQYYFNGANMSTVSSNLKFRNPKYLSMLNHLRFYLPEMYPKLDKILFLDDDVVVQKDLSGLWNVDLQGNVNGAVETCGTTFHRFDKYLNFANPLISNNFDPTGCGWAYGMNMFDLVEWKRHDITGIYHKWQRLNEDRTLWKLGTLPPGLITFYNLTFPLDKWWHVLGLGYNPGVRLRDIEKAAVVHYNGNMKPWLEIGMSRYKPYWSKYVKFDHPFLQQCNINE